MNSHTPSTRGSKRSIPNFDSELERLYDTAMEAGLWKGKYAAMNHHEYWAEMVQSYFGDNRENDHDHNHVNTRKELFDYDLAVANLVDKTFRKNRWQYVVPAKRKSAAHLRGYDPKKSANISVARRNRKRPPDKTSAEGNSSW